MRRLLVLGASAVLRQVRAKPVRGTARVRRTMARRPMKVAVGAQAAKTARIAGAMLRPRKSYRVAPAAYTKRRMPRSFVIASRRLRRRGDPGGQDRAVGLDCFAFGSQ